MGVWFGGVLSSKYILVYIPLFTQTHIHIYTSTESCIYISRSIHKSTPGGARVHNLTFTRYCFTSSRLCTSQSSFHSSGPPALLTLLQYYCTAIGQYTPPPRPSFCMPYTIQYW